MLLNEGTVQTTSALFIQHVSMKAGVTKCCTCTNRIKKNKIKHVETNCAKDLPNLHVTSKVILSGTELLIGRPKLAGRCVCVQTLPDRDPNPLTGLIYLKRD